MVFAFLLLGLLWQETSALVEDTNPETDANQIERLLAQAEAIEEDQPQQAEALIQQVFVLLETQPDLVAEERAYSIMGWIHAQLGRYDAAKQAFEKQVSIAKELGPETHSAALSNLASVPFYLGNYQEALLKFQEAVTTLEASGRQLETAHIYNNIGLCYRRIGAPDNALTYYFRALEIYEALDSKENVAGVLHNIAVLQQTQGDTQKAIETFRRVLALKAELGVSQFSVAQTYNQLGETLVATEAYDEGRNYLQKALEIRQKIQDQSGLATTHHSIADLYLRQGLLDQAQTEFEKSIAIREQIGEMDSLASSYLKIGIIAYQREQYDLAIQQIQRALTIYNEDAPTDFARLAYQYLAEIYAAKGDYKQAYDSQSRYQALREEVFNSERTHIMANLEAKYQEQQRQKEIDLLKQENLLKSEALAHNKLVRNLWIAGLLIGFTLLFLLYMRYQERKKLRAQQKVTLRLQYLDKLKDDFLANTSHELRTPLNGIIGLAESLADGATGTLPMATRENLDLIAASGKRLHALVNDLLDFSKMRNDRLTLHFVPVDLHSMT